MKIYHSALKDEIEIDNTLDYYESNGSYAFVHDITAGMHPLYKKAKCIYSEPSWRDGYSKFLKRANCSGSNFSQYLSEIRRIIMELNIPSFIMMGKHMLKRLNPEYHLTVNLHGYPSILGIWNAQCSEKFSTNFDVMEYVAKNYDYVLDFSVGYGNIIDYLQANNKCYIVSDINSKCIFFIAKKYMGYEG